MVGMGDYTLNTIKGHGFAVGDQVEFYGMGNSEFGPTNEPTLCVLTKLGNKYVLTYGEGDEAMAWEFGPAAKVWASKVETVDPVTDLFERAMCLGYDEGAAMRVADCFANYDMIPRGEGCPTHPNHSTSRDHQGYAVDMCEACHVIILSDGEGYFTGKWAQTVADRRAEYVSILKRDLADMPAGECACWIIMELGAANLPDGGIACQGCGSTFVRSGEEASDDVKATSDVVIKRNDAKSEASWQAACSPVAEEVPFTVTKEDILTRPGKPIDSLLNSGVKAPAVTNGDRFIWSEDGSEYEVVGLRNRGAQDELVIFSSGESLFMDRLKAMIIDGRMVPNSGCRSLNHVYCVGPCAERDRNEANASATRTHVETEAECLARIQREDFRVGDAYTFRNMTGYRLHQDRPFSCRGLKCQCGKACHGTVVESPEILTDVAHYVSGGLEIQGHKGSRAVIRPDRLD